MDFPPPLKVLLLRNQEASTTTNKVIIIIAEKKGKDSSSSVKMCDVCVQPAGRRPHETRRLTRDLRANIASPPGMSQMAEKK